MNARPVIQGFADEGVADRHFEHVGHAGDEGAEVRLAEIVAGIDAHAVRLRGAGGVGEGRQLLLRMPCRGGFGKGTGVQLDAIRADVLGARQRRAAGVDEQADPATIGFECGDQRAQALGVLAEIETVVGGDLAVAVGHQRGLGRARLLAQRQKPGIAGARRGERIAFQVQFHLGLAGQRSQGEHVVGADVALVRARGAR